MHLSLINPHIRVAVHSVISAGHGIARRVLYDFELIHLERGEFTLIYGDRTYRCHAGDLLLLHPGVAHSFLFDSGEVSQPHIHFDITYRAQSEEIPISFKDFDCMTETERGWIHEDCFYARDKTPLLRIRNSTAFIDIFNRILLKESDAICKKALLTQLISMIVADHFPAISEESAYHSVENRVRDYLDAGNGLEMNLEDFAKSFFYSKFYLDKKFKKAFGIGIIEYRNKKRMERATQLLGEHSVSETASLLGYGSIYSFSRAYKQYYGVSPINQRKTQSDP